MEQGQVFVVLVRREREMSPRTFAFSNWPWMQNQKKEIIRKTRLQIAVSWGRVAEETI